MKTTLNIFSWVFIILMGLGETWVLLSTEKYWPLSLDDYLGITALIVLTLKVSAPRRYLYMAISYAAMAGNIYAMLFNRLDPIHGSGERIVPLTVILIYLSIGVILSLIAHHRGTTASSD